ncbi:MAG: ketoacyl-ACP synthase III [Chitinophagaceae bacterium]
MSSSVITGSGSYLPEIVKKNNDFIQQDFYSDDKAPINSHKQTIIDKFGTITGIQERRYAVPAQSTSDMGIIAGRRAIADSGINAESLDLLIAAHNFGNVSTCNHQQDTVPALASRIKSGIGIINPSCIAFDTLFGCPGWLMGVMQAHAFFKAGMARKALIIGTETLSRVYDPYDRDSMIFSDGAGAVVLEQTDELHAGILSCHAASHCGAELNYLHMAPSNNATFEPGINFLKMKGRKVYEYALKHVPAAMKQCVDKSGIAVSEIKKIFIHQANEKMDEAILDAFYKLYDYPAPVDIMPMSIQTLGNSSVATIPTLLDLVRKNQYPQHQLSAGDIVLFASVGAGMNINAVCYKCI